MKTATLTQVFYAGTDEAVTVSTEVVLAHIQTVNRDSNSLDTGLSEWTRLGLTGPRFIDVTENVGHVLWLLNKT